MDATFTSLEPGLYQYTYPTFVDAPQYIHVHFVTADGQQAFVSYPERPRFKAAQLIPTSWFNSVVSSKVGEQPRLMAFIAFLLEGLSSPKCYMEVHETKALLQEEAGLFSQQLVA